MCLRSGERRDFVNTCMSAAIKEKEEIKYLQESISSFLIQNKVEQHMNFFHKKLKYLYRLCVLKKRLRVIMNSFVRC